MENGQVTYFFCQIPAFKSHVHVKLADFDGFARPFIFETFKNTQKEISYDFCQRHSAAVA